MDSKQELEIELNEEQIETEYEALKRKLQDEGIDTDSFEAQAKTKAQKILRKNRHELQRLQKHAENCLFDLNKDGYVYSIGKIRKIIRQEIPVSMLESLYETSVQRIIELAKDAIKNNSESVNESVDIKS